MSAGFTPGPWETDGDGGYGATDGWRVLGGGYVIAVAIDDVPEIEQQATFNACLIAAAPDLYEALSAAERLYQDGILTTPTEEYERVHALRHTALARASGK